MEFVIGKNYTRASVQKLLDVPEAQRGGNWDTGYSRYNGEIFIFCNVGVPGRTGHDYNNFWDNDRLQWSAQQTSAVHHEPVIAMVAPGARVHMFYRRSDRSPFMYAGLAKAEVVEPTSPVRVQWSFDEANEPAGTVGSFLSRDDIADELRALDFELGDKQFHMQRAERGDVVVYIKQSSGSHVLVIHPKYEAEITEIASLRGVHRPQNRFFIHNSTITSFPKRIHTGKDPIYYGLDFDFDSRAALRRFIERLNRPSGPPEPADQDGESANVDPRTEAEAWRAYRLGQQRFRQNLLDVWLSRCGVTGIDIPELLRASHIKAWALSTPSERLDPDNGLLLAVHIDGLFDRGYISFNDRGKILVSNKISENYLAKFGISSSSSLARLSDRNREYLKHHRRRFGFESV